MNYCELQVKLKTFLILPFYEVKLSAHAPVSL